MTHTVVDFASAAASRKRKRETSTVSPGDRAALKQLIDDLQVLLESRPVAVRVIGQFARQLRQHTKHNYSAG